MPRKDQGWITFQSSEEERKILEQYCQASQRTKTEILRELVRNLSQSPTQVAGAAKTSEQSQRSTLTSETTTVAPVDSEAPAKKSVKISARNIIPARVKRIVWGSVNAEVLLEIDPADFVSIITRASAEQMELQEGKEIYAVIKSSSVMLAEE